LEKKAESEFNFERKASPKLPFEARALVGVEAFPGESINFSSIGKSQYSEKNEGDGEKG
jgi:hypothetical protein